MNDAAWKIDYTPDARKDLKRLDESRRIQVRKAIQKVSTNPLPASAGGYGKPLGNKQGNNLTGLLKIKLRNLGIRVVYRLIIRGDTMQILVIGAREDDAAYKLAAERLKKLS